MSADWAALVPLREELGMPSSGRARERFAEALRDPLQHVLVAQRDGRVVGYAWVLAGDPALPGILTLSELVVDESLRGRGIGRQLFAAAAAWSKELGAERLQWWTSRDTLGFYRRLGAQDQLLSRYQQGTMHCVLPL